MTLSKPIANWQAKFAWIVACWGLVPVLGLPFGLVGVLFGWLGLRRVRRMPEDLGIRHAMGGLILGAVEFLVNLVGISCVAVGALQLINSK